VYDRSPMRSASASRASRAAAPIDSRSLKAAA
jgi:hypothetical protein